MTATSNARPPRRPVPRHRPQAPRPRRRLRCERLDDRTTPAVIAWDGGGDGVHWHDAANWDGDELPGEFDDAVIDLGANAFTVIHSEGGDTVRSLRCSASLTLSGGVMAFVSGTDDSFVAGSFTFTGGTIAGGHLKVFGAATITGGVVVDGYSLNAFGATSITGTGGDDTFTVAGRAITWAVGTVVANGPASLAGGAGTDTVVAGGGPTWQLTAADAGTLNGTIAVSSIERIAGGGYFQIQPGATFGGAIVGDEGNVLDYSALTGPITFARDSAAVPFIHSATGIDMVIGTQSAEDTFIGPDEDATWDGGRVNGFYYQGFEHLVGGSRADTFTLQNIPLAPNPLGEYYQPITTTIDGGAGTNRLQVVQLEDFRDDVAGLVIGLSDPQSVRLADTLGHPIPAPIRNITVFEPLPYLRNTVIGPDAGAHWVAGNGGVALAGFNVTAVQTLVGGSGDDRFTVNGGFGPAGRLTVYGMGGDDDIQAAGGVSIPLWLYGGDGNDRLKGGGGNNVLVGGAGDDLLVGGNDRDLIIGGTGADRVVGNASDDILIAGATAFDNDPTALAGILAEWTSGGSYAARVANLNGTGTDFANRLNGDIFLRVTAEAGTTTVFDDGAEDLLTGTSGQDWFFANLTGGGVRDRITDLGAAEFANDLSFITAP